MQPDSFNDALHTTVEVYDIKLGEWSRAPQLRVARMFHSGCSLENSVYLFFGHQKLSNGHLEPSIEILNTKTGANSLFWELFKPPMFSFRARVRALVAPLNDREILIVGGVDKELTGLPVPIAEVLSFDA